MANQNLQSDIEILLEKSALVNQYEVRDFRGQLIKIQGIDGTIVDESQDYELDHQQASSLKKLFFQSNKTNQTEMLSVLSDAVERGGEISRTACLTLIETGNVSHLISLIEKNYTNHTQHGYTAALTLLNGYMHYFWTSLDLSQIKSLRKWLTEVRSGKGTLGEAVTHSPLTYGQIIQLLEAVYNQTTHILASDVEERISTGYNPEINEDKEEIKRQVSRLGLPPDLSETLDKIDHKFLQAHDAFDFKGCLDLIRAFTERLYRSILDSYGPEGKKVDEKDSESVAKFFDGKGLVSDHFAIMIAQFRHFLSDEGSHRLKSREEDARLTKNMVIEMSLYLIRRFENN